MMADASKRFESAFFCRKLFYKPPRWWFRATREECSYCQVVENAGSKRHLTIVVCRRFCSRLNNKTASERSQGLLFLQFSGMLASPLGVAVYICPTSGNEGGEGMR